MVEVGVGEGSREGEVGVDGVGLNGSTGARVVEEGDEEGSNMYWAIHAGAHRESFVHPWFNIFKKQVKCTLWPYCGRSP